MPNYDKLSQNEVFELWQKHCETVQNATSLRTETL